MAGTMDLGISDHRERARCEQAPEIAITLLTDAAELLLAAARVLLREQPDPGREVATRSERFRIGNASDKSCSQRGAIRAMPGHDHSVEVQNLCFERCS
jgi:hypothetical protein